MKPLILIIEHDQMIIDSIIDIITDRYDYIITGSGFQALEILKTNHEGTERKIDGIILSVRLPSMNGLQFLEKWRMSETFTPISVILLSPYDTFEEWPQKILLPTNVCVHFVNIPFREAILLQSLENIIVEKSQKAISA